MSNRNWYKLNTIVAACLIFTFGVMLAIQIYALFAFAHLGNEYIGANLMFCASHVAAILYSWNEGKYYAQKMKRCRS